MTTPTSGDSYRSNPGTPAAALDQVDLDMLGTDPDSLRKQIYPQEQAILTGPLLYLVTIAGTGLALFTLYMAFTITIGEVRTRSAHLMVVIPLIFLLYPMGRRNGKAYPNLIDIAFALAALASFAWAFHSADRWLRRFVGFHPVDNIDLVMGIIAILAVFEATRRTVGVTIVVLNIFFMAYAMTGPFWPGLFEHRGVDFVRLIEMLYMDTEGMFNFIMGIMATFLFTFLMFGTFLRVSGGDKVFTAMALAIAGRRRGGPAKVSVISSAFMGMLSGSSISNVLTTGALSIPMMKKTGFQAHTAAAIETTASVGGGLMPPLMGSAVFIMASFTGVPLLTILGYSIVPAILYFMSIYFYIDVKARKFDLKGLPASDLPKVGETLRFGWHIFLPIFVLVGLLFANYTPFFASGACVVMIFIVSMARAETRIGPTKLLIALNGSTRIALTLSALLCSAAIIYNVSVETGLLTKTSSLILAFSGGSLLLAVVLIALMSYVLGMGLPVTAAYVIIAALGAPALGELGLSILAAHLIIFWLAQDSTITPPICMTAFAAARIAKAAPMKTGWESVKIAKALYIIPFIFAFGSLLSESVFEIVFDGLCLVVVFALMPMVFEGFWHRALSILERAIIALTALAWLMASVGDAQDHLEYKLAAVLLSIVAFLIIQIGNRRLSIS